MVIYFINVYLYNMDLLKLKKSISDYKENKNIENFRKVLESCSCITDDVEKEYTIFEKEGEYALGVKYSKQDLKEVKELLDEDDNLEIKSEDEDTVTIGEKTSDGNKFVKKSIEKLAKKRKLYITPIAIFDCDCNMVKEPINACVGMEYVSIPVPSIEEMLNSLLAEEYEAWYRYTFIASMLNDASLEQILKEIAKDELDDHSNKLLFLIKKLQLKNNLSAPFEWGPRVKNPSTIINSNNFSRTEILTALIRDEHLAIEHYNEVIDRISDVDCKNILKQIVADEEEHILKLNEVFK